MLLNKWQIENPSPSQNNRSRGDFYFESNFYFNIYWDATQRKFLIQFIKHPIMQAHVSYFKFFIKKLAMTAGYDSY